MSQLDQGYLVQCKNQQLALCTERKVIGFPLIVRELAFASLRKDQKKAEAVDF